MLQRTLCAFTAHLPDEFAILCMHGMQDESVDVRHETHGRGRQTDRETHEGKQTQTWRHQVPAGDSKRQKRIPTWRVLWVPRILFIREESCLLARASMC